MLATLIHVHAPGPDLSSSFDVCELHICIFVDVCTSQLLSFTPLFDEYFFLTNV